MPAFELDEGGCETPDTPTYDAGPNKAQSIRRVACLDVYGGKKAVGKQVLLVSVQRPPYTVESVRDLRIRRQGHVL